MIYLDYTANTPADPEVLDAYLAAERRYIANPNSTHIAGQEARAEMERVTQSIAQHLGVQPAEIIYTSGASEANNLALKGIAHASRHIGKHIISTQLEHSSVGASLSALQQQGYEIDLLDIGRDGRVDLDQLRELMRDDTILVAVCAVDSELGTIQPIREMAKATRRYAEGDFDIRMNDYGRDDELGELAASFNNMAENLQQTERQRREFITNISHELKTPMTTIAGYTDGILDGTIPPENERQYLQIISDESRRLSRLVRRMLDVSQLQAIDPLREGKHFDICESMRRVLISMERKITDRNLDVEADIPEEPILVLGDKDMITQVIYNLLENATKFAREGSTLYLGVTTIDGKARVTVRNEGDTIPAEELPLLFERFHKSDKSRSEDKDGYGLGLYIVKTILEQHKEKISVTSEDGVTAFSFSLATE